MKPKQAVAIVFLFIGFFMKTVKSMPQIAIGIQITPARFAAQFLKVHGPVLSARLAVLQKAVKMCERIVESTIDASGDNMHPRVQEACENLTTVQENSSDALARGEYMSKLKKDMSTKLPVDENGIVAMIARIEQGTQDLVTAGMVVKHELKEALKKKKVAT